MDQNTEGLKEQESKKPKILKILVLFMVLALWNLLLTPMFLFPIIAVLLGLIARKGWSTVLILIIAAFGIIMGILSKIYIPILPSLLLFWLGIVAYRQLGRASGSQIKAKATTGLKRIYLFLINAAQAFLISAVFLLLGYMFIARPTQVGTGMEPTIKKGSYVLNLLLPLRFINPARQDIVNFVSPENPETNYVSRIIGVPGDKIVLKDGYVYLNGKLLDEPYTLKPRSTFVLDNAAFGKKCEEITIPNDSYFLLGDNREKSEFSIYLGFIPKDKIISYIPHNLVQFLTYSPIDWGSHLRDTSHDKELMGRSILDVNKYVELINQKRVASGIPPLKYDKKLELSADLRMQNMVKYNDFSTEATKSGYTSKKSFNDAGFNSGVILEQITGGYNDSDYLFNGYWSMGGDKNLLDKSFQYVGIASKVVEVNNCPNQVTVQHFWGK